MGASPGRWRDISHGILLNLVIHIINICPSVCIDELEGYHHLITQSIDNEWESVGWKFIKVDQLGIQYFTFLPLFNGVNCNICCRICMNLITDHAKWMRISEIRIYQSWPGVQLRTQYIFYLFSVDLNKLQSWTQGSLETFSPLFFKCFILFSFLYFLNKLFWFLGTFERLGLLQFWDKFCISWKCPTCWNFFLILGLECKIH